MFLYIYLSYCHSLYFYNKSNSTEMIESRNLLYQAKKKTHNQTSTHDQANNESSTKEQLKELRILTRSQQTQIIRLKDQVKQLRNKIIFYQEQIKVNDDNNDEQGSRMIKEISKIPMIIQNKQLKQEMTHIHQVNLQINAKNRQLQAKCRQLQSETIRIKSKLKQLQILDSIRSENFKNQIENSKPILINDNKNIQILTEAMKKIIQFMKQKVVSVSYAVFQSSAKQCQGQKKTNSYNIFANYWAQLQKSKHLGYLALIQCLKSMNQLQKYLNYSNQQIFDINNSTYRDTLNEWVIATLTQIKYMKNIPNKIKSQKLFRLLGLLYRSQFPIKGQHFQLDSDVEKHFKQVICSEIQLMLKN